MAKNIIPYRAILSLSITSLLLLLVLLPNRSNAADPDPLQDVCIADLKAPASVNGYPCKPAAAVTSADFFFDGLSREGDTSNHMGSNFTLGNVMAFPGLNTLGLSMARVDVAPGGVTQPHLHPRAAELGVVITGKLQVGMITTDNVVYTKNVSAGELFAVPRGLAHYVMNVGEEKVLVFIAYNSQNPGRIQLSRNLFAADVPDQVLIKSLQVDRTVIDEIRSHLSQ